MPEAAGISYAEHRGGGRASGRPPLVLIHGAGTSRLAWPGELRRLEGVRVLAVDLPGHGRSGGASLDSISDYRDHLADWMGAIGLESAVLAGQSMGGAIALSAALDSALAAGLVLIATGGRLRVDPDILEGLGQPDRAEATGQQINQRWFGPQTPQRIIALTGQRLAELPARVLLDDFRACDRFDVLERLGEIDLPTLVLCGLQDQMTPEKFSRHLAYHIRGAHLEFIPDSGHMLPLEQPAMTAAAVSRFLQREFPA